MGEVGPSNPVPSMEQQMMSLEKMLKEQHDSYQQQLVSFMAANVVLKEENVALCTVAIAPCHDGPTGLQINTLGGSPCRSTSTNEPHIRPFNIKIESSKRGIERTTPPSA